MKKMYFIILFVLLGCTNLNKNIKDIENWDINLYEIEKVIVKNIYSGGKEVQISKEDSIRLIESFNEIEVNDIYEQYSEPLFGGGLNAQIKVQTNDEIITISSSPFGYLAYQDKYYQLLFDTEYFDVLREIDIKYDLSFIDWENDLLNLNDGYGAELPNYVICNPNKKINEVLKAMKTESRIDNDEITILDVLNSNNGDLVLNSIVEYKNIRIKIIEIKEDNRITAVIFHHKFNQK